MGEKEETRSDSDTASDLQSMLLISKVVFEFLFKRSHE